MQVTLRWWAAAALMTMIFCGGAVGAEKKTLTERMDSEALRIMMQFKNATWRLEMNFQAMSAEKESAAQESAPFQECCAVNVEKIERAMAALAEIFKGLEECYVKSGKEAEKADLALARADLAAFAKLIRQMSGSASREEAKALGANATRTYLDFLESAEALDDCPQH